MHATFALQQLGQISGATAPDVLTGDELHLDRTVGQQMLGACAGDHDRGQLARLISSISGQRRRHDMKGRQQQAAADRQGLTAQGQESKHAGSFRLSTPDDARHVPGDAPEISNTKTDCNHYLLCKEVYAHRIDLQGCKIYRQ